MCDLQNGLHPPNWKLTDLLQWKEIIVIGEGHEMSRRKPYDFEWISVQVVCLL